jgi:hypothetical protein
MSIELHTFAERDCLQGPGRPEDMVCCEQLVAFCLAKGRLPKRDREDQERSLANWLYNRRRGFKIQTTAPSSRGMHRELDMAFANGVWRDPDALAGKPPATRSQRPSRCGGE